MYIPFYADVVISTPAKYRCHVYLVVNPKRELEFKMAVTVGLQDLSSVYVDNTGKLICLLFKN